MHMSFGRATCAGHKQKYVRNELGIPSTQLGTQMHSLAWLGQGLCPAQHAISMSRGPPTEEAKIQALDADSREDEWTPRRLIRERKQQGVFPGCEV